MHVIASIQWSPFPYHLPTVHPEPRCLGPTLIWGPQLATDSCLFLLFWVKAGNRAHRWNRQAWHTPRPHILVTQWLWSPCLLPAPALCRAAPRVGRRNAKNACFLTGSESPSPPRCRSRPPWWNPVCTTANVSAQQDLPAHQTHGFQVRTGEKVWDSI